MDDPIWLRLLHAELLTPSRKLPKDQMTIVDPCRYYERLINDSGVWGDEWTTGPYQPRITVLPQRFYELLTASGCRLTVPQMEGRGLWSA
jgi:hypothetical protein